MTEIQLPQPLGHLSTLVEEQLESFASGSKHVREAALNATQFVFNLALQSEEQSQPHVSALLASFSPAEAPQTRSQTRSNAKRKRSPSPGLAREKRLLPPSTPLTSLFTEGLGEDQIWVQLELRAKNICETLQLALEGTGEELSGELDEEMKQGVMMDTEEDEEDEESEDQDEEDEETTDEEDGEEGDLGEDYTALRDSSSEDDEGEENNEVNLDRRLMPPVSHKFKIPRPKPGGHSELDDGFFDLASFNAETEEAEARSVSRGSLGTGLDEDESEDDEPIDLFANVDEQGVLEEEEAEGEASYRNFFDPPARPSAKPKAKGMSNIPSARTSKVRFHEEVRVKTIKARGKNMSMSTAGFWDVSDGDGDFGEEDRSSLEEGQGDEDDSLDEENDDEDDDEDDDQEGQVGQEESSGREIIERLKDDLFAEEEEEEAQDLTAHQKRQASLREQISALESENIAKKDWVLMGEATSRSRPQNSLLEEDLEFERVMKAVPVVTEDVVKVLEDRIKARILDNQFDDVVRRRPANDIPFLPSRLFNLQDTKSTQSLAQIYEDEYTAAQTGGVAGEDRDGKLKKEHDEIEKVWEGITSKLDALSNAYFTPKTPKATISTVSNVASATLESALPTTKSAASMLAPEEIFDASTAETRARSELLPAEKRALHNKHRKSKKKARDTLEKSVDKFAKSKAPKGVKAQKTAALKSVIRSGKGITVVGKQTKDLGARKERQIKS